MKNPSLDTLVSYWGKCLCLSQSPWLTFSEYSMGNIFHALFWGYHIKLSNIATTCAPIYAKLLIPKTSWANLWHVYGKRVNLLHGFALIHKWWFFSSKKWMNFNVYSFLFIWIVFENGWQNIATFAQCLCRFKEELSSAIHILLYIWHILCVLNMAHLNSWS